MFQCRNIVILTTKFFLCGKVYYSNTIIITIVIYTLIPNRQFENILSPHFCIEISKKISCDP